MSYVEVDGAGWRWVHGLVILYLLIYFLYLKFSGILATIIAEYSFANLIATIFSGNGFIS